MRSHPNTVKNKEVATTVNEIFKETFTKVSPRPSSKSTTIAADDKSICNGEDFAFNEMANPIILFLLFDLGVSGNAKSTSPLVQVSRSSNKRKPDVWAIHSRGHDDQVFGCLKRMGYVDNSKKFFTS